MKDEFHIPSTYWHYFARIWVRFFFMGGEWSSAALPLVQRGA
jgi:hypothetical protein